MKKLAVGIFGAKGRMGQNLIQTAAQAEFDNIEITCAVDRNERYDDLFSCNVIIEFSSSQAVVELCKNILQSTHRPLPALVIGSTGWTEEQKKTVSLLASKTPVLMSSNFSFGIFLLQKAIRSIGPLSESLNYDFFIEETHHVHKKDSPSGTAILLEKTISEFYTKKTPIQSHREGEIIGDHKILISSKNEEICLSHHAKSREIFSYGALKCAIVLAKKRSEQSLNQKILTMDDLF